MCTDSHCENKDVKEVVGGKFSDLHVTKHARIHPQCNDGDFTNEAKKEGKMSMVNYVMGRAAVGLCALMQICTKSVQKSN